MFHVNARALASLASLFVAVSLFPVGISAQENVQVDELVAEETAANAVPKGLGLRVRLVSAEKAPEMIVVGFRRGLYWKRAGDLGTVAKGDWTPWHACDEFQQGQGASSFVVVEFPDCFGFEAEFQLGRDGRELRTIRERGEQKFTVVVLPDWLLRQGVGIDDPRFAAGFQSLTAFMQARHARFDEAFADWKTLPTRYVFEADYGGYVSGATTGRPLTVDGRHSSLDAVRAELGILRHLGVNGFVGEDELQIATAAGMHDQFLERVTLSHAQAPWYKVECPFSAELDSRRDAMIASCREARGQLTGVESIWNHWGDEIGVVAKAGHFTGCDRCRSEFQAWCRERAPLADFGKERWEEVVPFADWKQGMPDTGAWPCETAAQGANLFWSVRFMGWTTARFYEPASRALEMEGVRISPLRGPTPTWDGHSLDYFDFYDATPTTAVTWETSNRDARVWQWDGYLASITQSIERRHGQPVHVYIKPHRGAPIQRLLATAARGTRSFNWYNYGPPYAQGDEFTGVAAEPLMMDVARAARILATAEEIVHEACHEQPRAPVAVLYPRTTHDMRRGIGHTNHFQDVKWVWTALMHEHVPVDVVSEEMMAEGDLEGRRALYVVGSHVPAKTQRAIAAWVRSGGSLWTDIEGLAYDEYGQPAADGALLTGQRTPQVELWSRDPGYKSTTLEPFVGPAKNVQYVAPKNAAITTIAEVNVDGSIAAVGRQPLDADGATVLATFADGKPAVIRRSVGAGTVHVVGTFAGLTYSEPVRREDFDMRRDFQAARRELVTCAVPPALVPRPATCSSPLVETALVRYGGDAAVFVVNWEHRAVEEPAVDRKGKPTVKMRSKLVPMERLEVFLPGIAKVSSATSSARGCVTATAREGGTLLTLDRLDAGDVILLRGVD